MIVQALTTRVPALRRSSRPLEVASQTDQFTPSQTPSRPSPRSLLRQGKALAHRVLAGIGVGLVALSLAGCDPGSFSSKDHKKIVHDVAVAVTHNRSDARQLEKAIRAAEDLYAAAHQAWNQKEVGEEDGATAQPPKVTPVTHHRRGNPDIAGNPLVGSAQVAPRLQAGTLRSPIFIGDEASYFRQARFIVSQAKTGDRVALQMYEFENAATNGDKWAAKDAPGYADQQALLGEMIGAAARGVDLDIILDGSRDSKTRERLNGPVAEALVAAGKKTGHVTLDFYPANVVNIDHAKELIHLTAGAVPGVYLVQVALVGGTNWGNHTPANDDGGALFFGRDALGAAQIFYRDQAFSRGDVDSPPVPQQDPQAPVQWAVTSPGAEGGGSAGIKAAKLALTAEADAVYLNQFCLNHQELLAASLRKGPQLHARLDPNELGVNRWGFEQIRVSQGQARWANTALDPRMAGQKNHQKVDVYVKGGVATAATLGSANDTNSGLESGYSTINAKGKKVYHKTNHEIDAVVRRYTSPDGSYSTAAFLDAALANTQRGLADASLDSPPQRQSGVRRGQF